ncbi:hypothetical protein L208DRAFT_1306558, partial [Tricholoma matsutake]
AIGRVSFTTDIWLNKNCRPHLAITAHWIAKVEGSTSLQLKASLIAFHRLHGGHDGVSLGKTVFRLLDRAGVTIKVTFFIVGHGFTDLTICQGWPFHCRQCQQ